jgi:hypothetical protein
MKRMPSNSVSNEAVYEVISHSSEPCKGPLRLIPAADLKYGDSVGSS